MKARKITHNGRPSWRIQWTENGKKRRKFFPSEAKATKWIREEKTRIAKHGREIATTATDAFVREAVELRNRLSPYGASLRQAVEFYIETQESSGSSKSLEELKKMFVATKQNEQRSPRTINEYNGRLEKIVVHFGGETKASSVSTVSFESFLDKINGSKTTRNHYRRVGHAFFAWALKRGYTSRNPVAAISRARVDSDLPGIFTEGQMKTMLELAEGNPHLTAWIAIGAYAGLRPSEIQRLTWDRVHLDSRKIDVTAMENKGARRRIVDIRPILNKILLPIQQVGGQIVPNGFEYNNDLRDFRQALKFKWPHDGLRHSFGTYHLVCFEDAGKTSMQMGHGGSPTMLYNHYYRPGISKAEAQKWWGESVESGKSGSRSDQIAPDHQ